MAFFVVTYDLKKKDEFDYQKLWDAFDETDSVKFQESDYFVSDDKTPFQVYDHFKQFIHEDDRLLVAQLENTRKPKYINALPGTKAWVDSHWP
jgi:hypothetical protein